MLHPSIGSHLAFQILLDKKGYRPGETVKGILKVLAKSDFHVRKLKLAAEGVESALRIVSSGRPQADPYIGAGQMDYDKFFSVELSGFLKSLPTNRMPDGRLVISSGERDMPFEFSLPNELRFSYNGVLGSTTYRVVVTADIPNWFDIEQEARFEVLPNHGVTDMLDENNPTKPDDLPNVFHIARIDLDNYVSRDRNFFGRLRSNAEIAIFGHDRPKEEIEIDETKKFAVGDTIRGTAIFRDIQGKGVRGLDVILWGIEASKSKWIALSGEESYYVRSKFVHRIELEPERNYEEESEVKIPFSIRIPVSVSPTYAGKFLNFFWGLETKLDIIFGDDPTAAVELQIN